MPQQDAQLLDRAIRDLLGQKIIFARSEHNEPLAAGRVHFGAMVRSGRGASAAISEGKSKGIEEGSLL